MLIGNLNLDAPVVMGILNVTPDSFSDGGRFLMRDDALRQAELMLQSGAGIIDVGGESTRPGAENISEDEETGRVVPVIAAICELTDAPVSVDTSKAGVMRAAVAAGAAMINDVRALQEPGALDAAAELQIPVCLMHMQGQPGTMQDRPNYTSVVAEVRGFLATRIQSCVDAGIDRERIVVDPGFGFGKTHRHNVELLANLRQLQELGRPVMVGLSRKSMLGELTGRATGERLPASIAAAVIALMSGAAIVRVHDVAATVDALKVTQAITEARLS
jgi:dihydropteroate synthase